MLSEFEADTAEFIMAKFAMAYIAIRESKWGYLVRASLTGPDADLLWVRYRQIVADARVRLPGSFIGGQVESIREGYKLTVEIY